MKRFSMLVTALIGLSGCTLALDYGLDGHLCGPSGECQNGYTCGAANICVQSNLAQCSPQCGPFEECIQQQCVPTCKGRACPSGTECRERTECREGTECRDGTCSVVPPAIHGAGKANLGALCHADADCEDPTSDHKLGLFCLIPFGGHASGVCSMVCPNDGACNGAAPSCKAFRSELGEDSLSLCVADSFTPCTTDEVCAPSGLVCGIYETGTSIGVMDIRAASACRAPIDASEGAVRVGEACQADASPCVDGLCIPTSTTSQSICTRQCLPEEGCPGEPFGTCAEVTVGGRILGTTYPYVRSRMCAPASATIGVICENNAGVCQADAPNCVVSPEGSHQHVCAPRCTDGVGDRVRCPKGEAFSCEEVKGEGWFCFKQNE